MLLAVGYRADWANCARAGSSTISRGHQKDEVGCFPVEKGTGVDYGRAVSSVMSPGV